ncbi:hypothetical protein V3N99_10945 [Dermatophilaceae bacterium Soc4.6]
MTPTPPESPESTRAPRAAGPAPTTGVSTADEHVRQDADRRRPSAGSSRVWRGAGAGRGLHVGTLPSRWFPADRDKLIYLAIAAHLAPAVLTQLVSAPTGAWFEDRNALVTTLEQQESDRP